MRAEHFLNKFDSGLIYGMMGSILGGVGVTLGFLPNVIGAEATALAMGTIMLAAEVIHGAVEAEKADAK